MQEFVSHTPCPNSVRICQELLLSIFLAYFFLLPFSLLLFYFKVSCKGELRNGKKFAKLVYFKPISGKSGVKMLMA